MNSTIETSKKRCVYFGVKEFDVSRNIHTLFAIVCITVTIISCSPHEKKQEGHILFEGAENIDIELKVDKQQTPPPVYVIRGSSFGPSHVNEQRTLPKDSISREFCDFKLIPLQNCEDAYVNQITKMQVCDSGFYVYSASESKILRFRHNGEFVSKIGEKGHGHGEYSEIITFCANNVGDSVYVMSFDGINLFDQNGNFIKNLGNPNVTSWQGFLNTYAGVFLSVNNRVGDAVIKRYDKNLQNGVPIMKAPQNIIQNYPSSWRNQLQTEDNILCYYDFYTSTFYIFDLNNMSKCKSYSLHSANILTEKWIRERPKGQLDANGSDHLESYVLEDHAIWGVFDYDGHFYNFKLDLKNDSCRMSPAIDISYFFEDAYKGEYYKCYSPSNLLDMLSPEPQICYYKQTIEILKDASEPYRDILKETDNFYILKMHRREDK